VTSGYTPVSEGNNLHRTTFLRSHKGRSLGRRVAPHVRWNRPRVHTSETASLSGPPLATVAVPARSMYLCGALPAGLYVAIGRC